VELLDRLYGRPHKNDPERAVERYDPDRGVKLWSFAEPYVRKAIQETLQDERPVPITAKDYRSFSDIAESREHLAQELGRYPTEAEVAEFMGRRVEWVRSRLADDETTRNPERLDAESKSEDGEVLTLHDTLADGTVEPDPAELADPLSRNPQQVVFEASLAGDVRAGVNRVLAAIAALPDPDRPVFLLSHGIGTHGKGASRPQIASLLGISEREVKTALQRAKRVLVKADCVHELKALVRYETRQDLEDRRTRGAELYERMGPATPPREVPVVHPGPAPVIGPDPDAPAPYTRTGPHTRSFKPRRIAGRKAKSGPVTVYYLTPEEMAARRTGTPGSRPATFGGETVPPRARV